MHELLEASATERSRGVNSLAGPGVHACRHLSERSDTLSRVLFILPERPGRNKHTRKHTPPSFPGTESTPKRASARVLVSGRMVGEDELPPTSGQQVARQTAQLAGTLLVTPQKNRPGLRP